MRPDGADTCAGIRLAAGRRSYPLRLSREPRDETRTRCHALLLPSPRTPMPSPHPSVPSARPSLALGQLGTQARMSRLAAGWRWAVSSREAGGAGTARRRWWLWSQMRQACGRALLAPRGRNTRARITDRVGGLIESHRIRERRHPPMRTTHAACTRSHTSFCSPCTTPWPAPHRAP